MNTWKPTSGYFAQRQVSLPTRTTKSTNPNWAGLAEIMATTRLRKTFHYPDDEDSHGSHDEMDEEGMLLDNISLLQWTPACCRLYFHLLSITGSRHFGLAVGRGVEGCLSILRESVHVSLSQVRKQHGTESIKTRIPLRYSQSLNPQPSTTPLPPPTSTTPPFLSTRLSSPNPN